MENNILAVVNGKEITQSDLDATIFHIYLSAALDDVLYHNINLLRLWTYYLLIN